jgi:hypothetical protein
MSGLDCQHRRAVGPRALNAAWFELIAGSSIASTRAETSASFWANRPAHHLHHFLKSVRAGSRASDVLASLDEIENPDAAPHLGDSTSQNDMAKAMAPLPPDATNITCGSKALDFRAKLISDKVLDVNCPAGCDKEFEVNPGWQVLGLGPYGLESAICKAAFVGGAIARGGGLVTLTFAGIEFKLESYADNEQPVFCIKGMARPCDPFPTYVPGRPRSEPLTYAPSPAPTTLPPSPSPTLPPSRPPSPTPTETPTTKSPSPSPSVTPTEEPSRPPTITPTIYPSAPPTKAPSLSSDAKRYCEMVNGLCWIWAAPAAWVSITVPQSKSWCKTQIRYATDAEFGAARSTLASRAYSGFYEKCAAPVFSYISPYYYSHCDQGDMSNNLITRTQDGGWYELVLVCDSPN